MLLTNWLSVYQNARCRVWMATTSVLPAMPCETYNAKVSCLVQLY